MNYTYNPMIHGAPGFRMSVFSERKYITDPNFHDEYCIFYLAQGRMKLGVSDDEYIFNAGDILFIEPNTPYYAIRTDEGDDFHYYSVTFNETMLGSEGDPCRVFFKECRVNRFLVMSAEMRGLFSEMRRWAISEDETRFLRLKRALLDILLHIIDTNQYVKLPSTEPNASSKASFAVSAVIEYVENHYREKISLDDIVEYTRYSKNHLLVIFKRSMNMSVTEYINNYRVEKACLELLYTHKTVTEIGINNGFNSTSYFTKIFRSIMECTPAEFRRKAYALIPPPDADFERS